MSDLATWKLHGPVATLRTETATWDAGQQDWKPEPLFTVTTFRPDGQISTSDTHIPGGSVAHMHYLYDDANRQIELHSWMNDKPPYKSACFYDDAGRYVRSVHLDDDGTQTDLEISTYDADGRRTGVRYVHFPGKDDRELGASTHFAIEGTDITIRAPGATRMITAYDEKDLPTQVILQDANHNSLREVILVRDGAGRLLKVETHVAGESLFQEIVDRVSLEDGERTAVALKQIFGESLSGTAYAYDSRGRLLERTSSMGTLKNDHTTYHYDGDHDEPIEEITEQRHGEANVDDNGNVHYASESVNTQHNRFEYRYDAHGNWTERIVSFQTEGSPDFQRSNIERGTITYLAG
jgi:hypothetical protein